MAAGPGVYVKVSEAVKQAVIERLRATPLEQELVAFSKRRIDNGGDSEIRYAPLWADAASFGPEPERSKARRASYGFAIDTDDPTTVTHYRSGGKPLRDTSVHLYNQLAGRREPIRDGVRYYVTGPLIAQWQHQGYTTQGPNFIPLNRKAVRAHTKGRDPASENLREEIDYTMAWQGVSVPARPIFRMAPEDTQDFRLSLKLALS